MQLIYKSVIERKLEKKKTPKYVEIKKNTLSSQ